MHIDVPEVTVDVGVLLEKTDQFVPGLKPTNFRVYEDGVEQKVEGFKRVEAPITALLLCEYAARGWVFRMDMLNAAWAFTQQLRPEDYVAMMTFDMNTHIEVDFTQDKNQIQQAINSLGMSVFMPAAFSETNVFDALYEAMDRLNRIEGRKYIILIASGRRYLVQAHPRPDSEEGEGLAGHHHLHHFHRRPAAGDDRGHAAGMNGGMRDMDYLQADNEMRTFASMTGGMQLLPPLCRRAARYLQDINENIRAKYELVYRPTNPKQDGTYRKLRVVLVDDEGQPLRIQDEKHKPLKYDIIARDGYRAKQEVE